MDCEKQEELKVYKLNFDFDDFDYGLEDPDLDFTKEEPIVVNKEENVKIESQEIIQEKHQEEIKVEKIEKEPLTLNQKPKVNKVNKSFYLPELFNIDIEQYEKKPWKNALDKSSYFNYGFNEESWRVYQKRIRENGNEVQNLNNDPSLIGIFYNSHLWHPVINFYLPHEYGGLGEILDQEYAKTKQIFSDKEDIPVAFPRTNYKNHEFAIDIESRKKPNFVVDVRKPLVDEWKLKVLPDKLKLIEKKQKEYQNLKAELRELESKLKKKADQKSKKNKHKKRKHYHRDSRSSSYSSKRSSNSSKTSKKILKKNKKENSVEKVKNPSSSHDKLKKQKLDAEKVIEIQKYNQEKKSINVLQKEEPSKILGTRIDRGEKNLKIMKPLKQINEIPKRADDPKRIVIITSSSKQQEQKIIKPRDFDKNEQIELIKKVYMPLHPGEETLTVVRKKRRIEK